MRPLTQPEMHELFTQFYDGVNPKIEHFSAGELLSTASSEKNGVPNSVPPVHLWSHILPTVRLLDRLRKELDYPIHLNSIYRNAAYNAQFPGAGSDSMHLYFNAIDFRGDSGNPKEWRDAVLMLRENEGWGIGGLNAYTAKVFVHVDTRHIMGREVWIPE